jgi:ribosomal protein S18 acetylase RimI-like enzyme
MELVDKALARRLEAAEEMPQVQYALGYQKLRPEVGAAIEKICGGHMIFAGLGSPVGRATGLGLNQPFTPEVIDRMEAFYRSHGAPAQVDVCPLHDPELFEIFKQRGYALAELNNVLFRRLHANEPAPPEPPGVQIRRGRPEEASTFAAIVARCFAEYGPPPEGFEAMLLPNYQFAGSISFVALVNGQPVGVGAGLLIPEHKILALFGAGTLPEFRGRGIQTALLGFRTHMAAQEGCEFAVIVTRGGTTSQRNAERVGFRLAYSKATLIKNIL